MLNRKRKIVAAMALLAAAEEINREEQEVVKKRNRRIWVHPWLANRPVDGAHNKVLQEFRDVGDQRHMYKNFLRMNDDDFNYLLLLTTPLIEKADTNMRQSIPASERLAVTLRFLATGDSFKSLALLFRIAACTISKIVPEICDAIYTVLWKKYMKVSVYVGCRYFLNSTQSLSVSPNRHRLRMMNGKASLKNSMSCGIILIALERLTAST